MDSWWVNHWWAIPAWLLGVVALIASVVAARRNPIALWSKIFFWLSPTFDPNRTKPAVSPWAICLALTVLLFLFILDWLKR